MSYIMETLFDIACLCNLFLGTILIAKYMNCYFDKETKT